MKKYKISNTALIVIIIALLLYSSFITYEHIKGKMLKKETNDIIEKQFKDHDIDPDDFNFDK